jgi:hypothetical protein
MVKTHIECGASQIKAKLKNKTILCCDISGSDGGEFEVLESCGMEAVHTSATSINFNEATRCYIPEDSKLISC